jgi:large subunit ribosomal protein L18e
LDKPSKNWAEVNIRSLAQHTKKNDTVIVPGKVLGSGELAFPVTVAAFSFSQAAHKKIRKAGGKSLSIPDLIKMNPKGKGVKIIG